MPKKAKARKDGSSSQQGQQDTNSDPFPPARGGYFPFAAYTAVVGVHTTLLAFAALFLPRTSFIPIDFLTPHLAPTTPTHLTSLDRPQHPFLNALTLSPASTLAWLCAGALVLQSWWGGWVRGWWIEWALQRQGEAENETERRIDRARADERKGANLYNAWLTTAAATLFLHAVLVLFGAPLLTHIPQTLLLALLLATLTVFPPAYTIGSPRASVVSWLTWVRVFAEFDTRTPIERALLYPAFGALAGCWLGAVPIALDWDRPWQTYPLPPAFGALGGYIFASVGALTASAIRFFADEHLRAVRSAQKVKAD
ncbi:GPI biosynthesis protein family Pig-F-domain-containing protein [Mycena galopus ATCC 62051]|nr:GPI biosynthesis protein family Pig-F-domain-containing protein [Mycena galopus ATCC 62051]